MSQSTFTLNSTDPDFATKRTAQLTALADVEGKKITEHINYTYENGVEKTIKLFKADTFDVVVSGGSGEGGKPSVTVAKNGTYTEYWSDGSIKTTGTYVTRVHPGASIFSSIHQEYTYTIDPPGADILRTDGDDTTVPPEPVSAGFGVQKQIYPHGMTGCFLGYAAYADQCDVTKYAVGNTGAYSIVIGEHNARATHPDHKWFQPIKDIKVYIPAGTTFFVLGGQLPQPEQLGYVCKLGSPPEVDQGAKWDEEKYLKQINVSGKYVISKDSTTGTEKSFFLDGGTLYSFGAPLLEGKEVYFRHEGGGTFATRIGFAQLGREHDYMREGKWLYVRFLRIGTDQTAANRIVNFIASAEFKKDVLAESYPKLIFDTNGDPVEGTVTVTPTATTEPTPENLSLPQIVDGIDWKKVIRWNRTPSASDKLAERNILYVATTNNGVGTGGSNAAGKAVPAKAFALGKDFFHTKMWYLSGVTEPNNEYGNPGIGVCQLQEDGSLKKMIIEVNTNGMTVSMTKIKTNSSLLSIFGNVTVETLPVYQERGKYLLSYDGTTDETRAQQHARGIRYDDGLASQYEMAAYSPVYVYAGGMNISVNGDIQVETNGYVRLTYQQFESIKS